MEIVGRAGLELGHEMPVDVSSPFGLSVNKQTSASDAIGQFDESREDVLEEPGSQPLSFVVDIDAESCEKRYWLRVSSGALPHTFGGRCYLDLGMHQA